MAGIKPFRRADIFVMAAVLLTAGVLFAARWLPGQQGLTVRVTVADEVVGEYPLQGPAQEYTLTTAYGTNVLCIEDGQAWISEADCPDGLCMAMGPISRAGTSLVCLPHRLVVEVIGEDGYDAVTR